MKTLWSGYCYFTNSNQQREKYLSRLIFTINASLIIIWVFCELSCDGIIVVFFTKIFKKILSESPHPNLNNYLGPSDDHPELNNFHINFTNYL